MNPLKEARREKGLSQFESAKGIGISYSMLVKMENGSKSPSKKTMGKTAKFYGKTVDELFFTNFVH